MSAQRALATLRRATRDWVGDDLCELEAPDDRTILLWAYGSTFVEAEAEHDGGYRACAWLVFGTSDRQGALALAASLGRGLPFGRLVVDEDGDVSLRHRCGPEASAELLEAELRELCRQADRLDDLLCVRLGGQRSIDRLANLMNSIREPAAQA